MLVYIISSYVIMFVFCAHDVITYEESIKRAFKVWIFSPIVLPLGIFAKFINW